jgi:hypothetical protein
MADIIVIRRPGYDFFARAAEQWLKAMGIKFYVCTIRRVV